MFGDFVGRGIGHRSPRMLVFVCKVTGRSMNQQVSANHFVEGLELEAEEVVDLNTSLDMKMVMYKVRLDVEGHCSLVRDVCPARLAEDGYILESPAAEDLLGPE